MNPAWAQAPISDDGRRQIFLAAEEVYCDPAPATVATVLGSCVAVCLWDRVLRFGGINHYVLPRHGRETPCARYGDVAIDELIGAMKRHGSKRKDLTSKIFGGAAVLAYDTHGGTIGTDNVDIACARLKAIGIPVAARRTGGDHGLYLRYMTDTGSVFLRALAPGIASVGQKRLPVTAPD